MVAQVATSLRHALAQKMQELEEELRSVGEDAASHRPATGEWCVKEVLSHLCEEEGERLVHNLRRLVDEETPLIGVASGLPYYTPRRQGMRIAELFAVVQGQYDEVVTFVGGLSDEQLGRKGRVPILRNTPIGEYQTLAQFADAMINFHLDDHISQIRYAPRQIGESKEAGMSQPAPRRGGRTTDLHLLRRHAPRHEVYEALMDTAKLAMNLAQGISARPHCACRRGG